MDAGAPENPLFCRTSCEVLAAFAAEQGSSSDEFAQEQIDAFGDACDERGMTWVVDEMVDHLEGESRYALLGISNSIMMAEITANRVLDKIDLPR
ncbi:DUF6124 family protein [Pseudomonas sp. LB1P83]